MPKRGCIRLTIKLKKSHLRSGRAFQVLKLSNLHLKTSIEREHSNFSPEWSVRMIYLAQSSNKQLVYEYLQISYQVTMYHRTSHNNSGKRLSWAFWSEVVKVHQSSCSEAKSPLKASTQYFPQNKNKSQDWGNFC